MHHEAVLRTSNPSNDCGSARLQPSTWENKTVSTREFSFPILIAAEINQLHMGAARRPLDLEKGRGKPHLYGFAFVADLIARDEDKSAAIYRRFDKLSARNLLYLESKLGILESEQKRFDEEDGTTFDLKSAAISWEEFEELAKQPDKPEVQKRMKLVTEIAETLRTYRKCRTFAIGPCMPAENFFRRGSVLE